MKQSSGKMYPARSNRVSMKTICLWSTTAWAVALCTIMALTFYSHGIAHGWQVPREQPPQMRSQVNYDPNLFHPFFESNEMSHKDGTRAHRGKKRHRRKASLKHTAKCFSTSFGSKHEVRFCEAKFLDEQKIDLFIHESNRAFNDNLRVLIRNGRFTCQYRTVYMNMLGPSDVLTWTTKRQKLTLDKKVYRKGEEIKGRIDVEILDELFSPTYPDRPPRLIKVYGVFKTIVQ